VKTSRFGKPPRALARRGVQIDNAALVPASLLPLKTEWQAIANELPRGDILIVLPQPDEAAARRSLRCVATPGKGKARAGDG
jgi:hypothetical protein